MPTPAAILLPLVGALNDPDEPFSFAVTGTTIIGQWEHGEACDEDETYRITVQINEKKGTYDVTECTTGTAAMVIAGEPRARRVPFGLRPRGGPPTAVASRRYTEPLFVFLEGNGYSRKRALSGRLFTR